MRARVSRSFRDQHFFFSDVSRGSRERSSALMGMADSLCLAALSGQPPKPAGSRRKARGVDGESARRATMCPSHYAANISAFLLILFLSPRSFVDVSSIDNQGGAPFRYASLAASPYIRSGRCPAMRVRWWCRSTSAANPQHENMGAQGPSSVPRFFYA
jgi:hypothetical protein